MYKPVIDSHIHFDQYDRSDREKILHDMSKYEVQSLIAISTNLKSSKDTLNMAEENDRVKAALGYHPEQLLPTEAEFSDLLSLIHEEKNRIIAIGEVGLPYFLRAGQEIESNDGHIELLEEFISLSKKLEKPIALHAVYEDAPLVCDLLEKYSVEDAHFHWFKGDLKTIERMIENRYCISITPDVLYEKEIMTLVKHYPLHLMMVETDGPWPFEGPFKDKMTAPHMMHQALHKISELKGLSYEHVAGEIHKTTVNFYKLN